MNYFAVRFFFSKFISLLHTACFQRYSGSRREIVNKIQKRTTFPVHSHSHMMGALRNCLLHFSTQKFYRFSPSLN